MNDNTITRIIPTIHFRLVFLFLFLFLAGFFTFIALLEGISISRLKLGDVRLEQLYLKWDNRLNITASKIDLSALADDPEPLDLKPLSQLPKWVNWTHRWIESIHIDSLRYNTTSIAVHYKNNQIGTIKLHHNGLDYTGHFQLTDTNLSLQFASDISNPEANITGKTIIHIPAQILESSLTVKLPQTPTINLSLRSSTEALNFKATAASPLTTIEPLADYLGVDKETRPWITTYAKGKRFLLDKFAGYINYNSDQQVIEQIDARAHIEDAAYTFDTALEPINAKRVDLVFQKGKLFITPIQGEFYKLPTQRSSLYIDFMPSHTMLYAHILTHEGKLNTPILKMLEHYDITVPIEQSKGMCDVDLRLTIDLHNYNTTAKGTFRPSESELSINGFTFNTTGGKVTLDTDKVAFSGFHAYYKNLLQASVSGHYDASKESGNIAITPLSATPTGKQNEISLLRGRHNLQINYVISSKGDRIDVTPSEWNFYGDTINIAAISAPFNYADSSMTLTKLPFSLGNKIKGDFSGNISSKRTNLLLRVDQFHYKGIELMHSPFVARFNKDSNGSYLHIPSTSYWNFGGQNFSISPLKSRLQNNTFIFNNIKIFADRQFASTISGQYNIEQSDGDLILNRFTALNTKLEPYADMVDGTKLVFKSSQSSFLIHSDHLGMNLESIDDGWKMKIDDISILSKKSQVLRQYEITNGKLNLYYLPKNNRYMFDGEINYPYKIMMNGDESLGKYRFSGSVQDGKSMIRINDRLMINYGETVDIRANNMGINVPEIYRWISKRDAGSNDTNDDNDNPEKNIRLHVTNGYLYLMKNRKILVDTLTADMSNNIIEGRMMHNQGSADFTIANDLFYIEGNHFNDRFMEHLFAFSDFYGGEMSFKAQGNANAVNGLVKIDNTILKEYRLLNNVLSFINTVPSLATFSLPNYNSRGLPVKEAYAHFTYQNHVVNVDNLVLNSPELKLVGNTRGNIASDTIDGEITLKTDLGSSLGKVPVVGYILFGDDGSLSTTLKISGKLSDPKVDTSIAKEIGIAPFNVLKRTVTYPFKWLIKNDKKP